MSSRINIKCFKKKIDWNLHSLFLSIAGWSGLLSTTTLGGDCLVFDIVINEASMLSTVPNRGGTKFDGLDVCWLPKTYRKEKKCSLNLMSSLQQLRTVTLIYLLYFIAKKNVYKPNVDKI